MGLRGQSKLDTRLLSRLKILHDDLEGIFNSAIKVLGDENIPDRIRISAYTFREILNWLYDYVVLPGEELDDFESGDLKEFFDDLAAKWDMCNIESVIDISKDSVTWSPDEQSRVNVFLSELRETKADYEQNYKSRSAKAAAAIKTLYEINTGQGIPEDLLIRSVKEHLDYGKYFNKVVHSRINATNQDEYYRNVERLKNFLVNVIEQDIDSTKKQLQELIDQGERDG